MSVQNVLKDLGIVGKFLLNDNVVTKNYIEVFGLSVHGRIPYKRKLIYTGMDGLDSENEEYQKNKGLVVGQEYEAEYLEVGGCWSTVKLKDSFKVEDLSSTLIYATNEFRLRNLSTMETWKYTNFSNIDKD